MKSKLEFYQMSSEAVMSHYHTPLGGLTAQQVELAAEKYGQNVLPTSQGPSVAWIFLKQFHNGLVYVLLLAALISGLFQNWKDAVIILVIIGINGMIGFVQEYRAEESMKVLAQRVSIKGKVYRDGVIQERDAADLVPGDIILVEEGDKVPADARLIELTELQLIEASLTGESQPVSKSGQLIEDTVGLADRQNMIWMGTLVATGWGKAVVVATGLDTALGHIAQDIQNVVVEPTHFHQQTSLLGRQLGLFAFLAASSLFGLGFFIRELPLQEMIPFTLSALVGGIPESLPIVLGVVLAIGAKRMSDKKAIIRSLPVTESLAVMDTILTDKTGTLTENNMTVQKLWVWQEEPLEITGKGLNLEGVFQLSQTAIIPIDHPSVSQLVHIAGLAQNGKIYQDMSLNPAQLKSIGDPTEVALAVLAHKAHLSKELLDSEWLRIADLPFRSEYKYRASLVKKHSETDSQLMVIGAGETILGRSSYILNKAGNAQTLDEAAIQEVQIQIRDLSSQAMRVIALAYRLAEPDCKTITDQQVQELILVGLVGIIDPPRVEVAEAIQKAHSAGVRVIMATGDHKNTALAIAQSIGLSDSAAYALEEKELENLSDAELYARLRDVSVLARLSPHTKLRVAQILQQHGHIIGMTGDGVNDAPALKKANIGIAMGIRGTDVAREASDIVLTDDNFASIVSAIEEGRVIFRNIRQTSIFLIITSLVQVVLFTLTLWLGYPLPLLAIQVLCLNLVTNGLSDIALATERSHRNTLLEKPYSATAKIVEPDSYGYILTMTMVMTALGFWIFTSYLDQGIKLARTMFFWSLVIMQFVNSYNMRSASQSLFKIGLWSNQVMNWVTLGLIGLLSTMVYQPFLQNILQFRALPLRDALVYGFISAGIILLVGEAYKWTKRDKKTPQVS